MRGAPTTDRALERLRRFCLSLPGVREVEAWGHPNFRIGGKTFAAFEFHRRRPSIAVKVEEGMPDLLVDDVRFFRTPYGGHRGWVSVWTDVDFDWRVVRDLIRRGYRLAAPGTSRRAPRTRPKTGARKCAVS